MIIQLDPRRAERAKTKRGTARPRKSLLKYWRRDTPIVSVSTFSRSVTELCQCSRSFPSRRIPFRRIYSADARPTSEPADRDVALTSRPANYSNFARFPPRRRKTANIDEKYQAFRAPRAPVDIYIDEPTASRPFSMRYSENPLHVSRSAHRAEQSSAAGSPSGIRVRNSNRRPKASPMSCSLAVPLPTDFLIIEGFADTCGATRRGATATACAYCTRNEESGREMCEDVRAADRGNAVACGSIAPHNICAAACPPCYIGCAPSTMHGRFAFGLNNAPSDFRPYEERSPDRVTSLARDTSPVISYRYLPPYRPFVDVEAPSVDF